jgi:exodeoxyribonuclease V beta subunit
VSLLTDQPAFDVCGPLPSGVTVLEASAGTGKTFTIAGLATRYVAEGRPLKELLLITFTRNATAELRDRVRERLVSAERGLERALRGEAVDPGDQVLALLAEGDEATVRLRHRRLRAAVADFDAATIVTTHQFCQEVLGGLGIAGDLEPGTTFVEDLSDLREQVVDDLYVRAFHRDEQPAFDRKEAGAIAREAIRNPDAPLEPAAADAASKPARRVKLAQAVRKELDVRKRRLGVMDYDDLLLRLDRAMAGDAGDRIAQLLRGRFRVVLVDEFQDTDPVQWRIVRRAFGDGTTTLVLIGDPKQAIYAFRGADVFAYLEAKASAGTAETLDRNWRSDQALLDAYDALFGDAQLGHPGIVYRRTRAASDRAPAGTPLRVRVVHEPGPVDQVRQNIAEDLAADVVRELDEHGLDPGGIAVLVRRNRDAELVRDALARANVPAVLNGAGSVFDTRAAEEWLRLLEALERPTSPPRAHAAALTAFLGWSATEVAGADDRAWEDVHAKLHRWAQVLRDRGVAALAEGITHAESVPERVLRTTDGERRLTDLRHVGELLHAAAMQEGLGVAALTSWLRRRITDAARELGIEERSRRLESDAAAVQVLTIHRSKGLEFPVVYLPFLWDPSPTPRMGTPIAFHDGGVRKVDVGLEDASYSRHHKQAVDEQAGEDLRLMYVGLTRARHRAVVWWAGTTRSAYSPLGRLVFDGRRPKDDAAVQRFEALAAGAPGCVAVERSMVRGPASWTVPVQPAEDLAAARFDRRLDRTWRRTSYSDLKGDAHEPRVASEPEEDDVVADEPLARGGPTAAAGPEDGAAPLLLGDMPGGTRVGTVFHDVFEAADFAAADLEGELRGQLARARARRNVDLGDLDTVVSGLVAAVRTPLGPLADGLRLSDVARRDRLDELVFELPLAGGDAARGTVTPPAIGAVLARHLAAGDPLRGYAERLSDPALRGAVRGYLTGSIDLVLRTPSGRFAVVDYKTNRLAPPEEPLTAWHHRPEALAAEMQRSHYALQALLYTVALHRYLRWRLPGYAPAEHLAGVLYLFVRGVTGGDAPDGVFAWRPPDALVTDLSDLLDRG